MIAALLKLRFAAMLSAMNNNKKGKSQPNTSGSLRGKIILMAILYLFVGAVFLMFFGMMFIPMAPMYVSLGLDWLYFLLFIIISFALVFLGSVFTTKAQIFEAKDNELLLSMPIKPRDIIISRMLYLLITNYIMELLVAIPVGAGWALFGNGNPLSWLGFAITVISLPLFSFALSAIFAYFISKITARIKNKTLITVFFSIAFLVVYFLFVGNSDQYMEILINNGEAIAGNLQGIPVLYWLGSACTGNLLHLLFAAALYLIPFAVATWVLFRSFIGIVTHKGGNGKKQTAVPLKISADTAQGALLKREFSRLFHSATYIMNCGVGLIMMILFSVFLAIEKGSLLEIEELSQGLITPNLLCAGFSLVLMGILSLGSFTSPSISLEGKGYPLTRSLPVSAQEILLAKRKMHIFATLPLTWLSALILGIVYLPGLEGWLAMLILPTLYALWTGNIGLICNLHHPVLDWVNEAQPVKQGISVLLTMLFTFLLTIITAGVGIFATIIFGLWAGVLGAAVVLALGVGFSHLYLVKRGTALWEAVG